MPGTFPFLTMFLFFIAGRVLKKKGTRLVLPDVNGLAAQVDVIRRKVAGELSVTFFGEDFLDDCVDL